MNSSEPKVPYRKTEGDDLQLDSEKADRMVSSDVMYHRVTQMAINPRLDTLVFATDSSQILKLKINLERPFDVDQYEYLITSFHSKGISGLDVCVKKQLIATCATDRTVRIWSYNSNNQFTLDASQSFTEDTYSLALHPSGLHIVVGFSECIRMMNILDKSLVSYKTIFVKNCREISFSHGGHYFACQNAANIQVYKFYTGESPENFVFKGHTGVVKSISWLEDDTGFVSCGWDCSIFLWKLLHDVDTPENPSDPVWEFRLKNNTGNCVAIYRPDDVESHFQPVVYATSTDKTIRELKTLVQGSGETVQLKVKESQRFEEQTTFSQVLCSFQRKFLICGTAEQDKPSSIQIFKRDFAKVCEIQAHSKQLSRLKLSFDNTKLFSVGEDGVLAIYSL